MRRSLNVTAAAALAIGLLGVTAVSAQQATPPAQAPTTGQEMMGQSGMMQGGMMPMMGMMAQMNEMMATCNQMMQAMVPQQTPQPQPQEQRG